MTPDERIQQLIQINRMRKVAKQTWPEINGLKWEKNNGTSTINGTKSSDKSHLKTCNQPAGGRKSEDSNAGTRRQIRDALWNLCLFGSSVFVIIGTLLAIYGAVIVFHNMLHGNY